MEFKIVLMVQMKRMLVVSIKYLLSIIYLQNGSLGQLFSVCLSENIKKVLKLILQFIFTEEEVCIILYGQISFSLTCNIHTSLKFKSAQHKASSSDFQRIQSATSGKILQSYVTIFIAASNKFSFLQTITINFSSKISVKKICTQHIFKKKL